MVFDQLVAPFKVTSINGIFHFGTYKHVRKKLPTQFSAVSLPDGSQKPFQVLEGAAVASAGSSFAPNFGWFLDWLLLLLLTGITEG